MLFSPEDGRTFILSFQVIDMQVHHCVYTSSLSDRCAGCLQFSFIQLCIFCNIYIYTASPITNICCNKQTEYMLNRCLHPHNCQLYAYCLTKYITYNIYLIFKIFKFKLNSFFIFQFFQLLHTCICCILVYNRRKSWLSKMSISISISKIFFCNLSNYAVYNIYIYSSSV